MKSISKLAVALLGICVVAGAHAQTEFTPPEGKGHVVIAVSGAMGAAAYEPAAKKLASMGYDVFLYDGNKFLGDHGAGMKAAIDAAQSAPNALPGKIGVVGFSLGGGQVLGYAPQYADTVAAVVVMYPLTKVFQNIDATVARIKVPVLMFAGEKDHFRDDCCTVATARAIAAAATAINAPLELVTYPTAGHDFIVEGSNYDAKAAADAWTRTTAMLAKYLNSSP